MWRVNPTRTPLSLAAAALSTQVREVLSPSFVREVLARGVPGYRQRILTVEVMALALLHLVLAGLPSLADVVRDLKAGSLLGVPRRKVSMSAFYKRLVVMPHTMFLSLLKHTSVALRARSTRTSDLAGLVPFATGIFAIDDTTLDALVRKSKALKATPEGRFAEATLGGRLGCVLDLVDRTFVSLSYDTASTSNERNRLLPLVETLEAGSLVLLDRGYFAFDSLDALSERFVYWLTRFKAGVKFDVLATLVDAPLYRDRIVHLGSDKGTDRGRWPVRLVELRIDGEWWQYVTNVWDPRMFPADRVWRLYSRRWTIEVAFAAVKRALGLATIHACHTNGVLSQVWATLTIYQVLQHLRRDVADACGWDEEDVSWDLLMRRIGVYADQCPAEDLMTWLLAGDPESGVRKTGKRIRRMASLPAAMLGNIRREPAPLPLDALGPFVPRQRPSRVLAYRSEKFTTHVLSVGRSETMIDTR